MSRYRKTLKRLADAAETIREARYWQQSGVQRNRAWTELREATTEARIVLEQRRIESPSGEEK
jgi:hypothetical protein